MNGEIRIQVFAENLTDIESFLPDYHFVRPAKNDVAIYRANHIKNRTDAENARGTELFINRSALPQLPAGEHYITDLIGMKVLASNPSPTPSPIRVAAVHNFGAGDILELDNGEMLAFAGAKVDYEKRVISLNH